MQDIVRLFGMIIIQTYRMFQVSERCFYTPTHTVNLFDLRCRKFFLRQICHNNFSRIFHFETNDPYGKLIKLSRSFAVIIFWNKCCSFVFCTLFLDNNIGICMAFTFKKYKKAPQAHVLGSRGMLSPLQGVNEGDSVPLTK